MSVCRENVDGHPVYSDAKEELRANVRDAPELHLSRPDFHAGIELAVDRDDLPVVQLHMLEEEKTFREALENRKKVGRALDDERPRQPAEDLLVHHAMRMGVIPEEPRPLAPAGRNVHSVIEPGAGM